MALLSRFLLQCSHMMQMCGTSVANATKAGAEVAKAAEQVATLSGQFIPNEEGLPREIDSPTLQAPSYKLGTALKQVAGLLKEVNKGQGVTHVALQNWSTAASWLEGYSSIFTDLFLGRRLRVSPQEVPRTSFGTHEVGGMPPPPYG